MRTSSAKAKGRRLSQSLKELILSRFGNLEQDDIIVTPSGVPGEDIQLSPRARKYFPYSVECKNQEKTNIWAWMEQAEQAARKYPALLIFSRNRSKIYACMDAELLLDLIQKANKVSEVESENSQNSF